MAYQTHNQLTDDLSRLTTSITATGDGVAVVGTTAFIDLGAAPPAFNVNTTTARGFGRFAVMVDWTSIVTTTDEAYYLSIEGSNTTNFATLQRLGLLLLGTTSPTGNSVATPPNGRAIFYCDNRAFISATDANSTQAQQYIRFKVTGFGVAPSITITGAWMVPL